MQAEVITRKEARALGLTIGRMDYLLKIGKLKYVPDTNCKLYKADVERIAAMPPYSEFSGNPKRATRGPYLTNKDMELAVKSLTVCAQLLKNQSIRRLLGNPSMEQILKAAEGIENRLNWKRKKVNKCKNLN